jgi:hypothetical protein
MTLRRKKSRKAQAAEAVSKAAKGAKKAAKGTAAYQVAKRTPIVRRIPLIVAGAAAAVFVAVKARSGPDQPAAA